MEPLVRFASVGERLDPELRAELLALGPAAIPGLLRFIEDENLWDADSPSEGWAPLHAVDLLAELKATESIEPMLDALGDTDWDEFLHDRLIQNLPKLGASVLEPALARLTDDTPEDLHHALCAIVAQLGVRDPRIFEALCSFFADDLMLGAMCLGDYGDPAALPLITRAIEAFVPEFDHEFGTLGLPELIEAHEQLAGPLPPELRARADDIFAAFVSYRRAHEPAPRPADQVGRNDPCSCGSGLKFKKCCLNKTD